MVEKLWERMQFGLVFDNVLWRELLVSDTQIKGSVTKIESKDKA